MCRSVRTWHFHGRHLAMVVGCLNQKLQNIAGENDVQYQRQLDRQRMMLSPMAIDLSLQFQHRNQFERVIQRHPKKRNQRKKKKKL